MQGIFKKARFNFKFSGKPMNGNVFGNKTIVIPDKPFALIFDLFPFLQDKLIIELAIYLSNISNI